MENKLRDFAILLLQRDALCDNDMEPLVGNDAEVESILDKLDTLWYESDPATVELIKEFCAAWSDLDERYKELDP